MALVGGPRLHAQPAAQPPVAPKADAGGSTLNSQPAVTNRVLELDGTNSYVELPPNIFNDLTEATVEGWVEVESLRLLDAFLRLWENGKRDGSRKC